MSAIPQQRPVVAVLAVCPRADEVLLVRRANPPDAGRWGFPGGKIENGEPLLAAAERELHEETGIEARAREVFTAVDAFDIDEAGTLRRHFVLVAVLCEEASGVPLAGDDALEAAWFPLARLEEAGLALSLDVAKVARMAADLARQSRPAPP
ncbi:MAG: ADP-ribose pyrophosphatase [Stappia sp.]|uniref:NUDIX hydrolase n=1 Tax=Stappia sp. TaxID=1870903 RepID=UPI000C67F1DE|nr:NUDIX hydrolase [Stappia sp.]MAA96761.1 ADP-ribose pyrophosphatase [Stappia sp.]MBM21880.1 ADP-ribose pyrophosphatase [Stappia sp.]